jgi:hypothetical protein
MPITIEIIALGVAREAVEVFKPCIFGRVKRKVDSRGW